MSEYRGKHSAAEVVNDLLTLGEVFAIEQHFGLKLSELSEEQDKLCAGAIWALERRSNPRYRWADVESLTVREATTYFRAEEIDVDPDDPDSDEGKDGSLAA